MSNFDLHEFNILSQRHNYFMTNNRINGFPVLKESSIFLKKILAQRTSNSTGKKISLNLLNQNHLGGFKPDMRQYQSPIIINNRISNDNYNNYNIKSIKANISRNINNPKSTLISPARTSNNTILINRIITPTYYKIPINATNRLSKSPNIGGNLNLNNVLNDEIKVLNFGGKKIFASNSFNGLRSTTNTNTPMKSENSELFRNYDELKKKKDEIFRRKMKRDSSTYGKELLKLEKDKDIKEQSINNDKLRIIPLKKRILTRYNSKENIQNNKLDEISNNNINNNKNKSHNIIVLQKSKNLYNKKKFKTNNIFISKNTKNKDLLNTINNNGQINQKIKDNLEYLRIKNNKSRTIINNPEENDNNIININNLRENKTRNKKFVEDYNPNISQIIYSNDRKISIKMHVLKDKNFSFPKETQKEETQKNLQIQKLISISYKCCKRKNLDNEKIKNKKMVKRIKNLNADILSSIKEEEEKTKPEYKINDIKKDGKKEINNDNERPLSAFGGGVRNRYLNKLHNK